MDISEVRVLAAGTALPGPPIDNAALARRFGMDGAWEQWIAAFVGTDSRHLAVDLDTGEVRSSLSELGALAAERALRGAALRPADIDVLVLGTSTPEMLMPATVNVVADRLGINDVPTYQLQSGCAGAVQALDVARGMLATGARNALVIGGEVCAKHFDLSVDLKDLSPAELVNVVLFGDGAGAAVLTADPVEGVPAVRRVLNRLTGQGREPGQSVQWFGLADRASAAAAVKEDYKAIEESVPLMAAEIVKELLADTGWDATDVDYLLPPQLSGRMTARIVEELGLAAAEEVSCVRETANTGNALPFFQFERALAEMTTGDRALCVAVESSKWIKAGIALECV
ncbi:MULTISPECIES: 3-oxoacyl-ACP synthase III family protein [Actinomadura]|uniref:3-oxoacyl-ACP synthase III family protein n=1 Tax=Actinomadura TaxID=1988 RepID=UPI001BE42F65|nr:MULTISPECIES: 3-oxoacyl-ACP synthase III family protein [Actinomadura]MBT2210869.1 3-oxoacyl-ACP synthase III family protein [Actinomadura sp. NEAU-AAG7]